MNNPVPAILFGTLLLLIGGTMLYSQRRAAQPQTKNDRDLAFQRKRCRRRSQIAGMILLIGIMIPLGDSLIDWRNAPGTFGAYWFIVIGLAIWTGLLAVGDIAATRAQMTTELNQLHRHQLELKSVARRLEKPDGNGPANH